MELKDKRSKIAVFMESAYLTNRELLKGFLKYVRLHGYWTPLLRTGRDDEPSRRSVRLAECAAIVTDRLDASIGRIARLNGIPVVTVLGNRRTAEVIADVTCDNASVARLAADHLIGRGFRSFAYVGGDFAWSRDRGAAFRKCILERRFSCAIYQPDKAPLADFLTSLPLPVGVFAANDVLAQPILEAARTAGLAVPDDVALVGVDNDEILCESSDPTLTSVRWDTEDVGYQLGAFLHDALAANGPRGFRELLYRGSSVVSRASTARRSEADGLVWRCKQLIEVNDPKTLSIVELAKKLAVSRRTLERRFFSATGRSLGDTLTDIKIERAEQFLRMTGLTQDTIATECGFCDASHMNAVFKRTKRHLPSFYRQRSEAEPNTSPGNSVSKPSPP